MLILTMFSSVWSRKENIIGMYLCDMMTQSQKNSECFIAGDCLNCGVLHISLGLQFSDTWVPQTKLFPKPIFFSAVELPSQSRSLLTQAGAINKYMHTSKKVVSAVSGICRQFWIFRRKIVWERKTFQDYNYVQSLLLVNKRIKRNFVAKFVVRIYALFPICLDWKNRILQTLSFFGCMIILCSYMLIANCRRFNWTCKKHTKPPRICSHCPKSRRQGEKWCYNWGG